MVEAQQDIGLHKLRFDGRSTDGDDRLSGEDGCTLGDCPDIAGELKVGQIIQEFIAEQPPLPQVGNVLRIEVEILNILDDLLQPRRNGKAAPIRGLAVEHIEISDSLGIALFEIAVAHGQLIKIAEHGQIQFVVEVHGCPPSSFHFLYYTGIPEK